MSTLGLFRGRFTLFVLIVAFAMILLSGAALGATEVDAGHEQTDMAEELHDSTFTDDGELKDTGPNAETQPEAMQEFEEHAERLSPDTPRLDNWLRQHLIIPMIFAGFWLADVGYQIGYAMASTIGVGATKWILNGAVLGLLTGVTVYVWRVFRGVKR